MISRARGNGRPSGRFFTLGKEKIMLSRKKKSVKEKCAGEREICPPKHEDPLNEISGGMAQASKPKCTERNSERMRQLGAVQKFFAGTAQTKTRCPEAGAAGRQNGAPGRSSVSLQKSACIRPTGHPGSLRCSSVKYCRYSPSSRLVLRAPRRPRYYARFLQVDTSVLSWGSARSDRCQTHPGQYRS